MITMRRQDRIPKHTVLRSLSYLDLVDIPFMNTPYLYAHNICREKGSGTYHFYSTGSGDMNIKAFGRQCENIVILQP